MKAIANKVKKPVSWDSCCLLYRWRTVCSSYLGFTRFDHSDIVSVSKASEVFSLISVWAVGTQGLHPGVKTLSLMTHVGKKLPIRSGEREHVLIRQTKQMEQHEVITEASDLDQNKLLNKHWVNTKVRNGTLVKEQWPSTSDWTGQKSCLPQNYFFFLINIANRKQTDVFHLICWHYCAFLGCSSHHVHQVAPSGGWALPDWWNCFHFTDAVLMKFYFIGPAVLPNITENNCIPDALLKFNSHMIWLWRRKEPTQEDPGPCYIIMDEHSWATGSYISHQD